MYNRAFMTSVVSLSLFTAPFWSRLRSREPGTFFVRLVTVQTCSKFLCERNSQASMSFGVQRLWAN
jgi:hypothetical protein